jgi:polyhydroxyalkanoate synthase
MPFTFSSHLYKGYVMSSSAESLFQGLQKSLAALMQGQGGAQGGLPAEAQAASQALFQALQAQHLALWQQMLNAGKDQPAPVVAEGVVRDRRFSHTAWQESRLHDYLRQAYLLNADYIQRMIALAPEGHEKNRLMFFARQVVDALAPSNFIATNPEFIQAALATQGESIRLGMQNLIGDLEKGRISMTDESVFEVGKNLATTPGAVVYENEVMQLIQYAPQTKKVAARPLLIVPPCINKFYILDLQPENSLVRYAVEQGQTVFLISWRNVSADLGSLTWDDYLEKGPIKAIEVMKKIRKTPQINALGFCVGGTILTSALAVLRAGGSDPVASLTLLTTLLDFSDTGELAYFIDEPSLAMREATIGQGGLLSGRDLSAVFSALRANDLIWPYVVNNYLKGMKPAAFDLLYWNSDSTNLPGPFLVWYLRHMYLENSLREPGKLTMCGQKVDLKRVDMPVFLLACREDHIVPWKTSYLGRSLLGGGSEFVLGASGHIAGVINPAAKNKRSYWVHDSHAEKQEDKNISADAWLASAKEVQGSWWPRWMAWLNERGGKQVAAPRRLGSADFFEIEPAPGRYVKEKA